MAQFGIDESAAVEGGAPWAAYRPLYFISLLASFIGAYVLQAGLTHGAVMHFNGRSARLGDCAATGLRFFLPVFAITLVAGIGLFAGALLFIIPAFFLMCVWAVIVPAAVVERTGVFGAFARSAELTRDHRWAIFFLGLALVIASLIIQIAAAAGAALISASGGFSLSWASAIALGGSTSLVSVVGAVGVASVYFELRSIKEGVGAEELAAVFD